MACETKEKFSAVHEMTCKNWRGEVAQRRVIIRSFRFGTSDWHKTPCWLMKAFDVEKQEEREFALLNCNFLSFQADM